LGGADFLLLLLLLLHARRRRRGREGGREPTAIVFVLLVHFLGFGFFFLVFIFGCAVV